MVALPFLADAACVADADELIRAYGDDAGYEAAARADASRNLGNAIHFARWRQIERLIVLLSVDEPFGTVH
jgi:hypothetical protein